MTKSIYTHPHDCYPKLWKWYLSKTDKSNLSHHELLIWNITKCLADPGKESSKTWINAADQFLKSSLSPRNDFLSTDAFLQDLGASLTELLSTLSEISIRVGEGSKLFKIIQQLADRTNLSAVRFLSAWVALNINDLASCIDECEKETEPNSPIYTLLGQALLEDGRASEAIDALNVAIKLNPSELLAYVQIIKAYLVVGNALSAVPYITKCRALAGDLVEVDCLAAMIVISSKDRSSTFSKETMNRLVSSFEQDPFNLDLLYLAFDVVEVCNNSEMANSLLNAADFIKLSKRPDFLGKMAILLRRIQEKGWFATSSLLSEKLMPIYGQVSKFTI